MDIRDQDDNLNPHPEHMANMSDARELAKQVIEMDGYVLFTQHNARADWQKILALARAILA